MQNNYDDQNYHYYYNNGINTQMDTNNNPNTNTNHYKEYWQSPDYPKNYPLNKINLQNNEIQVYYKKAIKTIFKEAVCALLPGGWILKIICNIFF